MKIKLEGSQFQYLEVGGQLDLLDVLEKAYYRGWNNSRTLKLVEGIV